MVACFFPKTHCFNDSNTLLTYLLVTCGVLFKAPHSAPMKRSAEPPSKIVSNDNYP